MRQRGRGAPPGSALTMLEFEESITCRAPAVEVWKLLHDPSRFPEWWSGLARVTRDGEGGVTRYMKEWPDFAYPTRVRASGGRVVVSCLLSTIEHEWTLEPGDEAGSCVAHVRVRMPEEEAPRLQGLRDEMRASLPRLAAAAERSAGLP